MKTEKEKTINNFRIEENGLVFSFIIRQNGTLELSDLSLKGMGQAKPTLHRRSIRRPNADDEKLKILFLTII